MSFSKSVTIIGGGIAGLSAAVFLREKGFEVKLIEASPKLGGRAYSFFDKEKNQFFDNGQHILAGWYRNTFEYLKIIGSYNKLDFQNTLEVNFINTDKKVYKLKCPDFSPPMNLIIGLLRFNAFNWKDKLILGKVKNLFTDSEDYEYKFPNVRELLTGLKQTINLIKYFWDPFVLAVFNSRLENVSTKIFLNVLKIGFNEKNNSTLVIPKVNLNELLIDNAVTYFEKNDVTALLDRAVSQILVCDNKVAEIVMKDGEKISSDYYICAVPFFAFKRLFSEKIYYDNKFRSEFLKTSAIVSVHLFFENEISDNIIPDNSFGMTGLIGTIVQWVFKRNKHHLSLVISGADELQITDLDNENIYELCINDLRKTIEGFEKLNISDYKIIKEKRATFIPDNASNEFRPAQKTKYENLFLAGDWTDTGMPATIESAVTSARIATNSIINDQSAMADQLSTFS